MSPSKISLPSDLQLDSSVDHVLKPVLLSFTKILGAFVPAALQASGRQSC